MTSFRLVGAIEAAVPALEDQGILSALRAPVGQLTANIGGLARFHQRWTSALRSWRTMQRCLAPLLTMTVFQAIVGGTMPVSYYLAFNPFSQGIYWANAFRIYFWYIGAVLPGVLIPLGPVVITISLNTIVRQIGELVFSDPVHFLFVQDVYRASPVQYRICGIRLTPLSYCVVFLILITPGVFWSTLQYNFKS